MPKIEYKSIKFQQKSLELIRLVNQVVEEYQAQGYELTLRQAYYQLVARGYIPNNERSYKNIGNLINDGRLAGLIDWHSITDRTRNLRSNSHWDNPADVIASARYSYLLNKWDGQPNYVEVWVEKDALVDIVGQACRPLDTPYFSCRGYTSQSEMWSAAQRFISQDYRDNRVIIHLGDHDPSGIDMTRDIQERLQMFGADVYVKRVALTMNQIGTYNPPPNPAKITDSRASKYIDEYGNESWELDVCGHGMHFCQTAADCFNYYSFNSENKVAEVIAYGDVRTDGDKSCTDKLEIVREIPWDEVLRIVNIGKNCTGRCNTGDWNKSSFNTGCFNTEEQKITLFNKPSGMTYREWMDSDARYLLNQIPKDVVEWVYEEDMTDEEKATHPTYETTGGYLKVLDESECGQLWWGSLSDRRKEIIKAIPNFDAEIFFQCTGVRVDE